MDTLTLPATSVTTFDLFFSEANGQWGFRELVDGDVRKITFHADMLYVLGLCYRNLSVPLKVGPAVSAWACQFGRCRCYRGGAQ